MDLESVPFQWHPRSVIDRYRRDDDLQVRILHPWTRPDAGDRIEEIGGHDSTSGQEPSEACGEFSQGSGPGPERHGLLTLEFQYEIRMIVQVLTDTGQVMADLDAHIMQMVCRSDTRQHQWMRRTHRARTQYDLPSGMSDNGLTRPGPIGYARSPGAVEYHALNLRMGLDREVAALAGRIEIGARGAATLTLEYCAV